MIISFKGNTGGGGGYVLPPATTNTLGGIKVGSGLTVQNDGTLSADGAASDVKTVILKFNTTGDTELAAIWAELMAQTGSTVDTTKYAFYAERAEDGSNKKTYVELRFVFWDSTRLFFSDLIENRNSDSKMSFYEVLLTQNGSVQIYKNKAWDLNDFQPKLSAGTGIEITSANTINCTVTGGTGGKTDYFLNSMTQAERLELFSTLSAMTEDAGSWGNENLDDIADISSQFNFYVSLETDEYFGWAPVYYARRDSAQKFVLTGIAVKRDSGANFIAITAEIPNDGSLNVSTSSSS